MRRAPRAPSTLLSSSVALTFAVVLSGCSGGNATDAGADVLDVQRYRDGLSGVDNFEPTDAQPQDTNGDSMDSGPDMSIHVRIGNLLVPAAGIPPAFDVCARSSSGPTMAFVGPLLASTGLSAGVAWDQVSAYLPVPAGHYDLMLVAAHATDCNTPIAPLFADQDLSAMGGYATVFVVGALVPPDAGVMPGGTAVSVLRDHDPHNAAMAPQPLLRLFDALPGALHFDVGTLDPANPTTTFMPIWGGVGFGQLGGPAAGLASSFDSLGYFMAAPLPDVSVGAALAGSGTPLIHVDHLNIMAHTYSTSVLGLVLGMNNMPTQGSLVCVDSAQPTGGLSSCATYLPGM